MFGWSSKKLPLTTAQLLVNTDRARIRRANLQVKIVKYEQEFIIKKISLINRIKNFFTRAPVNTLFVKFTVSTFNVKNKNRHKVIVVIPYLKGMDKYKLSEVPIQVYSDTADFKYRFAWELKDSSNLFTDAAITKKLGIALEEKPTDVRPLGSKQLDKHLYAVVSNIDKFQVTM